MNQNDSFPSKFFIITFVWSWIIWAPLVLGSFKIIQFSSNLLSFLKMPILIVGVYGPLVGALCVLYKKHGRVSLKKYLHGFLDFKIGYKAYIFPIIIFGSSTFIAWFAPELFGKERLPMLLPSIWLFIPYFPFMILMGGGQEEFGWRGYVLPILESKYGVWFSNIIIGIIWALWHIPLWFIANTSQSYMNFGGFILLMIGYSYILSWIRKISGSKPFSGLYVHGLFNAFIPFMPTFIMQKDVSQPHFWIWVILTFLIGIIITILRDKSVT